MNAQQLMARKGGLARAAKLSKASRVEISMMGVRARLAKKDKKLPSLKSG